ncbi:hypothetical protein [Streptosporangium sp. NBC_01469]|uniref:hypothetical protein n=1 Tax=Streptosporangium sp. NBC_01469 TaxID=2903898 RepID=UPI002E290CDC|nr:hypothetical protein [Streptosporangium sp. NBC_01469]
MVDALAEEFPHLRKPETAIRLTACISSHYVDADPRASFEEILDSPATANWRLKPNPDRLGRVRVACCRIPLAHTGEAEAQERARVRADEDRINALLPAEAP